MTVAIINRETEEIWATIVGVIDISINEDNKTFMLTTNRDTFVNGSLSSHVLEIRFPSYD